MGASFVENNMGFVDKRFWNYAAGTSERADRLEYHYNRLADREHPYVRMAAGGIAMQLALLPQVEGAEMTLEERLNKLELAETCWRGANLYEEMGTQSDKAKGALALSEVQRQHLLASIPVMRVAASWQAGEPLRGASTPDELREKTQRDALRLGEEVLRIPPTHPAHQSKKALVREFTLNSALGQRPHRVVVPASVRQRHTPIGDKRAAMVAFYRDQPAVTVPLIPRALWKHQGAESVTTSGPFLVYRSLLALDSRLTFDDTLEALILEETGHAAPQLVTALRTLEGRLSSSIDDYREKSNGSRKRRTTRGRS